MNEWGASRLLVARLGISFLSQQSQVHELQVRRGACLWLPRGILSALSSLSTALLTRPSHFRFQVVFGKKLPAFATIHIHKLQHEKKYDIYFADGKVYALYR